MAFLPSPAVHLFIRGTRLLAGRTHLLYFRFLFGGKTIHCDAIDIEFRFLTILILILILRLEKNIGLDIDLDLDCFSRTILIFILILKKKF